MGIAREVLRSDHESQPWVESQIPDLPLHRGYGLNGEEKRQHIGEPNEPRPYDRTNHGYRRQQLSSFGFFCHLSGSFAAFESVDSLHQIISLSKEKMRQEYRRLPAKSREERQTLVS
jgi:hypothetical protein